MKLTEEQQIAQRYKKFGATEQMIHSLVQSGIHKGFSRKAALIGVRLGLSEEFKTTEYFSPEDVAEVTGATVEEVMQRIEEKRDDLEKLGGILYIKPSGLLC